MRRSRTRWIGLGVVVLVALVAMAWPAPSAHGVWTAPATPGPARPAHDMRSAVPSPPSMTVAFAETVVTLPGFDPLYGYVYGSNCVPGPKGCFSGGKNYSQVPVLSSDSTQPFGIYYVDNASDLVESQVGNGTVRVVAPVTLLYQTYATYGGMLPNEFTIEYGYDEALFLGLTSPTAADVSVETVNLTTGAVEMVNTPVAANTENQGAVYVGSGTVIVFSPRTAAGVNMTTGRTWVAASLPFFEANNIYWLPQRHQLINVEADGADGDEIQQLNETHDALGDITFNSTGILAYDHNMSVNWVNGIGYDPAQGRIAFSSGGFGIARTYVLAYNSSGVLTTAGEVRYNQSWGGRVLDPDLFNGQRYVYTSMSVMGGFYGGRQYLFDPWNGTSVLTNEPFTDLLRFSVCDAACFLGDYAPSPTVFIDFHASVARNDPFWSVVIATA